MTKIKSTLTSMVMATPLAVAATPTLAANANAPHVDLSRSAGSLSVKVQGNQEWQWGAPVSAGGSAAGYRDQNLVSNPANTAFDLDALLKQPKHPARFATLTQRDGKWSWTQNAGS